MTQCEFPSFHGGDGSARHVESSNPLPTPCGRVSPRRISVGVKMFRGGGLFDIDEKSNKDRNTIKIKS